MEARRASINERDHLAQKETDHLDNLEVRLNFGVVISTNKIRFYLIKLVPFIAFC